MTTQDSHQDSAPSRPACFGVLEKVFPHSKQGLREVQEQCWNCAERVECLRAAISEQGQAALAPAAAPQASAPLAGVSGFLSRWSRLKSESKKGGR